MFGRKGIQGICVRCGKVNKVHNGKDIVVGDKTSIEFTCDCGQHNVMHLLVVRRRLKKPASIKEERVEKDIPEERTQLNPFVKEGS